MTQEIQKTNQFFNRQPFQDTKSKTEKVNNLKLNYLIENKNVDKKYVKQLKKYKSSARHSKKEVNYCYAKKREKSGFERLYARDGQSLQMFEKEIRSFLAEDFYYDVDISNSHPMVIYNLCKSLELPCEKLQDYILNRSDWIEMVQESNEHLESYQCKQAILGVLNGMGLKGNDELEGDFICLKDFKTEIDNIRRSVVNFQQFNFITRKYEGEGNLTKFSSIVNYYERKLLMKLQEELNALHYNIDVLIHDGFLVDKNKITKEQLEADIKVVVQKISEVYGFSYLELKIKPFHHNFTEYNEEDQDKEKEYNFFKMADKFIELYGDRFCISDGSLFYKNDEGFWVEDLEQGYLNKFLIKTKFYKDINEDYQMFEHLVNCNKFYEQLRNKMITQQKDRVFQPNQQLLKDNEINTFPGFTHPTSLQVQPSEIQEFIDLVMNQAQGDQKRFEFLMKWYANVCKGNKNETCIILFSDIQGTGKSCVSQYIGEKLLPQFFYQTSNMESVFSRFNDTRDQKLLILLEEISAGHKGFNQILKDAITNSHMSIESKGKQIFRTNNLNNFVITSNEYLPVRIEQSDRRFNVFKVDERLSKKDLSERIEKIQHEEYQRKVFSYLYNYDTSEFNPRQCFNTTEKEEVQIESTSVSKFFHSLKTEFVEMLNSCMHGEVDEKQRKEFINSMKGTSQTLKMSKTQLYSFYESYIKTYNLKYKVEEKGWFFRKINKLKNVETRDVRANNESRYIEIKFQ